MNWDEFSRSIFDSNEETCEWIWYACKLNFTIEDIDMIPYNNWLHDLSVKEEPKELKRKIFRKYGLESYLERPNCPSLETFFLEQSMRSLTTHTKFR